MATVTPATPALPMNHLTPGDRVTALAQIGGALQALHGWAEGLPWSAILGFLGMILAPVANALVNHWLAGRSARASEELAAAMRRAELAERRLALREVPADPLEDPRHIDWAKVEAATPPPAERVGPKAVSTVHSRPECTFNYCPYPSACVDADRCVHPH